MAASGTVLLRGVELQCFFNSYSISVVLTTLHTYAQYSDRFISRDSATALPSQKLFQGVQRALMLNNWFRRAQTRHLQ